VTQDDLLYRFRLRTFAIAHVLGNVRAACRAMGIHPSTFYRWKHQLDRHGPEILRPRERRHRAWPTPPARWSSSGWSPSPRPPWIRPGPDRRRARQTHLGRDPAVDHGCGGCCAVMG
jgi:hypothetical protein